MNKRRIVNFRTFLFSAVFVTIAVLSFSAFKDNAALFALSFFLSIAVQTVLIITYRKNSARILGMLVVLIAYLLALFSCMFVDLNYERNTLFDGDEATDYRINGKIEEIYDDGISKRLLVCLTDTESSGKVMVYLQENAYNEIDLEKISIGDYFNAVVKLKRRLLIEDGKANGYYYRLNVRYTCYVKTGEFSVEPGKTLSYDCYVREIIRRNFISALGKRYGELAYGMIVGDKSQIEFGMTNDYGISGIGHILAVSGLHIMFLSGLISWVCKTLKAGKKLTFVVSSAFLILYNLLVGFSASVFRATVMCTMMQIAGLVGERNDSLNNLGLACTVYLIVRPFGLFDAGFLMSVGAVLGIIIFMKPISCAISRLLYGKLKKISSAVSLSLAAQIGIVPAMMYYFSRVSVYSVIVNVVLSYAIMVTFIVLFVSMVVVLIIPAFAPVACVAYPGLFIMDATSGFVSRLPYADLAVYAGGAVFGFYLIYFIASRFVMKGKVRRYAIALCIVYCLGVFVMYNVPFYDRSAKIYCFDDTMGQSVSVVADEGGKVAMVAYLTGRESLTDRIKDLKIHKVDEIILLNVSYSVAREIVLFAKEINVGRIYVPYYDKEFARLWDDVGIDYIELKENGESEMGFFYLKIQSRYHAAFSCYEKILFVATGFEFVESESELLSDYSLIRAAKGNFVKSKTVLCNDAYYGKNGTEYIDFGLQTYYFDLKTGKIEIFN